MITIEGNWFDGKTSGQLSARLEIHQSGGYVLHIDGRVPAVINGDFQELNISPRLGNTPSRIEFRGDAVFETNDNPAVDQAIRLHGKGLFYLWLHQLESHWPAVIFSVLITVVSGYGFIVYGVPAIATLFANNMPSTFLASSDQQTLAIMDEIYFQKSEIDQEKKDALRAQFLASLPELDNRVNLEFRKGDKLGANAFALPGGTVLFTDEMVALAENTEQLQAVFAHEIGHLIHKHSLRRVAQNSIVSVLFVLITGDASGTSELLSALPFLLTDMAYSRQFENEADDYAKQYLLDRRIDTRHFSDLMARLECSQRDGAENGEGVNTDAKNAEAEEGGNLLNDRNSLHLNREAFDRCLQNEEWRWQEGAEWTYYLLSHPPSADRINKFLP